MIRILKKYNLTFILLLGFLLSSNFSFSQWEHLGPRAVSDSVTGYNRIEIYKGKPIIAYRDKAFGKKCTVLRHDGSNWTPLGIKGFSSGIVDFVDLKVIDTSVYVTFRDGGLGNQCSVMRFDGTNWVNIGGAFGGNSNFQHNIEGVNDTTIYVAFRDQTTTSNNGIIVKRYNGSNWTTVGAPDLSNGSAILPDIILNNDTLYVVYVDISNSSKLTVKKFDGTNWVNYGSPLFTPVTAGQPSLSFINNTLYVSFVDNSVNNKMSCMKFDGANWVYVGTPGYSLGEANQNSLVNNNGILYSAFTGGTIVAAKASVKMFNGTEWVYIGDSLISDSSAAYTRMAIYNDTIYIGYQDVKNDRKASVMRYTPCNSPQVDLEDSKTYCSILDTISINGSASAYTSLSWSTNGDGTFITPNQLNSEYILGTNDQITQSFEVYLQANGVPGCPNTIDTMNILLNDSVKVLEYSYNSAVGGGVTAQFTIDNLTTCQDKVTVEIYSSVYTGSAWISGNSNLYVNGIFVGNYANIFPSSPFTIVDISQYIPIQTVQLTSDAFTWHYTSGIVRVTTCKDLPLPPTTTTQIHYCIGEVASPLSANLNGNGQIINWFQSQLYIQTGIFYAGNTPPTPLTTTIGSTSYWVSQVNSSGVESYREQITVNIHDTVNSIDSISSCGIYTWIDGNDYFSNNTTATHNLTTIYGCDSIITLNLTITPPPIANAGLNQTICTNTPNTILNGIISNSTGGIWSTNGSGTFTPSVTDLNATYNFSSIDLANGFVDISLTTTGNGVCTSVTDSFTITFTPAPLADAGINQFICANTNGVLLSGTVSNSTGGTWTTNGTGIFSPSANDLNATYIFSSADTANGTVIISLTTTGNGICSAAIDSLVISFYPAPIVNAGLNEEICPNIVSFNLNGVINGGASFGIWSGGTTSNFSPAPTDLNAIYTPTSNEITNGNVELYLCSTDATINNCNDICDTIQFVFNDTISPAAICDDIFLNLNSDGKTIITASQIDISTDNCGIDSIYISDTILNCNNIGDNEIILTVIDYAGNSNTCKSIITIADTIAQIDAGEDIEIEEGESIELNGLSYDDKNISWSPTDFLDNPFVLNPISEPESTITYTLSYTFMDECTINDSVTITVNSTTKELIIRNLVTPNDDGKNDYWTVNEPTLLDGCKISIKNRWGTEVYNSTGYDNSWNATINGEVLPDGSYYYFINCTEKEQISGVITIIKVAN